MSKPDEKKPHTYEEWLTWDGTWELIHGRAYNMSPAPTSLHQFIVGELHFALRTFFQNRNCYVFVAPFDVYFSENDEYTSPDHITQPDLGCLLQRSNIQKGLSRRAYLDRRGIVTLHRTQGFQRKIQFISTLWGSGILDCRPW